MSDFVSKETVDFQVNGKQWSYKPVSGGDENDWLNDYMVEKEGKIKTDLAKLNECKTRNLVKCPYSKDEIKEATGIDKDWAELSKTERWLLIKSLKPKVFSEIITRINEIDEVDDKKKS